MSAEVSLMDPRLLKANPFNTNRVGPENMAKLEASIRDLGFVTAVVVRELGDGSLQILGGQHRVETACKMGLKEVPVINLGRIADVKAKKIGLVDNSRYGIDDTIGLAALYEDIGLSSEDLAKFLPFTQQDFESISRAVEIDVDELDFVTSDEDPEVDVEEVRAPKPAKTHDFLRFRVSMGDAERIRQKIEKTIKAEGLADDDDLTSAGSALALLLLGSS